MAAVDLQGRSARLGAPTKVTIATRAQPVVVTGVPPMHVDFVTPIGQSAPQVLNVSVVPDGFYAQYDTADQTSMQSSSQHTTSWSVGVKEEASLNIGFGDVEEGEGLDNTTKIGAEQAWKGSVQSTTDYGNAEEFNASIQTRFADYVRYDESRMNIYIYPVIGKTACPADKVTGTPPNTSCTVPEVPLTVQFSGPDQAFHQNVDGTSLEWYQPPWQPGNILSYPGNQSQLQALQPDLVKFSQDDTFQTDGLSATQSTTWSGQSGTNTTTSTSSNYSFDASNSFTAAGDIAGFYAKANLTVDVSGSFGFEGLTTSQTSLGESAGVLFTKPGTFLDPPNYQYAYTPVIYGQQQPGGLVNDQSLDTNVTHLWGVEDGVCGRPAQHGGRVLGGRLRPAPGCGPEPPRALAGQDGHERSRRWDLSHLQPGELGPRLRAPRDEAPADRHLGRRIPLHARPVYHARGQPGTRVTAAGRPRR